MNNLKEYIIEKLKLTKDLKSGVSFPIKLYVKFPGSTHDEIIYKKAEQFMSINLRDIKIQMCRVVNSDWIYSFEVKNKEQLNRILIYLFIEFNLCKVENYKKTTLDFDKINKYIENYDDIESYLKEIDLDNDFIKKLIDAYCIYNLPF